jgi:ankyrin repeat protein
VVRQDGAMPLWIAAQEGHLEICKELVDKRADVNKADSVSTAVILEERLDRNMNLFLHFFMGFLYIIMQLSCVIGGWSRDVCVRVHVV